MFAKRRVTIAVTAQMLLACFATPQPAGATPGSELIDRLEAWLDANTDLPRAPDKPTVRIVDPSTFPATGKSAMGIGKHVRGLYDPETSVIHLVRPWSADNAQDISVLVHELVHHRQSRRHYFCAGSQELHAYKLQKAWLAQQNEFLDVNWIGVVLASSCAPRDVHPD